MSRYDDVKPPSSSHRIYSKIYGAKIKYDSKNMRITNNNLLNSLLKEEMREGWSFTDF